jgi:hypothetical protein
MPQVHPFSHCEFVDLVVIQEDAYIRRVDPKEREDITSPVDLVCGYTYKE